MTTRIVTFDDGVSTGTVPSTATTTGPAATVTAGSASALANGATPTVTNTGTTSDAVFNFGIPAGDTGTTGAVGTAATIAVGTTTTGATGTNAIVANSGNTTAAIFDFTIPTGPAGPAGQPGFNAPSAVAALEIDWDNSTLFTKSISADSTFTFANVSAGTNNGKAILFYLSNTSTTEKTITWPTSPDTNVNGAGTTVMAGESNWLFSFLNIANTIVATGSPV